MKKMLLAAVAAGVFIAVIMGCKKTNPIPFSSQDIVGTATATLGATSVPTNTPTTAGATNTPTQVATETPTGTAFTRTAAFDDMSDCNNQNLWNGYWYTYDDGDAGGTSTIWPPSARAQPGAEFIMSSPGRAGAPDCAARITGVVTKLTAPAFEWGFVAMGTQVDPGAGSPTYTYYDFSAFETTGGISFWTMGDGKSYAIKLKAAPSVPVGDAGYEYVFTAPATWTQVTVYFGGTNTPKFAQPGWTPPANIVPVAQVLAKITDIQFQTVGQPHASIDLWVDDMTFVGCTF
jgi:hypothetical protein